MAHRASPERVAMIVGHALQHGDEVACTDFDISPETLARYKRLHKTVDSDFKVNATLRKIGDTYTEKELKAIAKGGRVLAGLPPVPVVDFQGDRVKFVHFTDTHMGSVWFREEYWESMLRVCDEEKIDFGIFSGDLTHGMDPRKAELIYELTHLGYDRQKEYAVEKCEQFQRPLYAIDGNHDRWFYKNGGALIVKDVAEAVDGMEYLGTDEGNVSLGGNVTLKLWHGEDGNSYAVSYRLQKVAEAFSGGEKPHIWCGGHTHKAGYFFPRMIHMISGGAMSVQTRWMRSKRLGCDTGFWICEVVIGDHTVARLKAEWFPFYA